MIQKSEEEIFPDIPKEYIEVKDMAISCGMNIKLPAGLDGPDQPIRVIRDYYQNKGANILLRKHDNSETDTYGWYFTIEKTGSKAFVAKIGRFVQEVASQLEEDLQAEIKRRFGKFEEMGRIDPEEIIDLHYNSEKLDIEPQAVTADELLPLMFTSSAEANRELDKEKYLFSGVERDFGEPCWDGTQTYGVNIELKAKREFDEQGLLAEQYIARGVKVEEKEYEKNGIYGRYLRITKEGCKEAQHDIILKQFEHIKQNIEQEIEKAFQEKYGRFYSPIVPEEIIEFHYNIQNLEGPESIKLEEKKEVKIRVLKVERIGNYEYKTIKTSWGEETLVRRIPRRKKKRNRKN